MQVGTCSAGPHFSLVAEPGQLVGHLQDETPAHDLRLAYIHKRSLQLYGTPGNGRFQVAAWDNFFNVNSSLLQTKSSINPSHNFLFYVYSPH